LRIQNIAARLPATFAAGGADNIRFTVSEERTRRRADEFRNLNLTRVRARFRRYGIDTGLLRIEQGTGNGENKEEREWQ
jgi:hypothetical protein